MKRAKDIPAAINWHEGMLLTPQHFQQFAARQEDLVAYAAHAAAPYFWGVHRLDLLLQPEGLLQVRELEAVMPDGLIVELDPEQKPALEISLADLEEGFTASVGTPSR